MNIIFKFNIIKTITSMFLLLCAYAPLKDDETLDSKNFTYWMFTHFIYLNDKIIYDSLWILNI